MQGEAWEPSHKQIKLLLVIKMWVHSSKNAMDRVPKVLILTKKQLSSNKQPNKVTLTSLIILKTKMRHKFSKNKSKKMSSKCFNKSQGQNRWWTIREEVQVIVEQLLKNKLQKFQIKHLHKFRSSNNQHPFRGNWMKRLVGLALSRSMDWQPLKKTSITLNWHLLSNRMDRKCR